MIDFLQLQNTIKFLTQHNNLRIIALLATLLKIIPNTYFILWLPDQWIFVDFFSENQDYFQINTDSSSSSSSSPAVQNFITRVFRNSLWEDLLCLDSLFYWPFNLFVITLAIMVQIQGDAQMIVQAGLVDQSNED